jgi:hypothetical protein
MCLPFLSTRLDDARMLKARRKKDGSGYESSYISANERALMMGFPSEYVTWPRKCGFRRLCILRTVTAPAVGHSHFSAWLSFCNSETHV